MGKGMDLAGDEIAVVPNAIIGTTCIVEDIAVIFYTPGGKRQEGFKLHRVIPSLSRSEGIVGRTRNESREVGAYEYCRSRRRVVGPGSRIKVG